jgi:hypothetical protein
MNNLLGFATVVLLFLAMISWSLMLSAVRTDLTRVVVPAAVSEPRWAHEFDSYMFDKNETLMPAGNRSSVGFVSHVPTPTMVPQTFLDPFDKTTLPPYDMSDFPGKTMLQARLYEPKQLDA